MDRVAWVLKYGLALASWCSGTRVRRSGWGQTGEEATWEEESYLFQPQTDWDHCRVCRLQPLAGTGPAGSLAAEGRRKLSKGDNNQLHLGGIMGPRSQGILGPDQENQSSGTAHA